MEEGQWGEGGSQFRMFPRNMQIQPPAEAQRDVTTHNMGTDGVFEQVKINKQTKSAEDMTITYEVTVSCAATTIPENSAEVGKGAASNVGLGL